MGFFKSIFAKGEWTRTRINVEVIAGHPQGARYVNICNGDNSGEVLIEVAPGNRLAYILDDIEWEEQSTRSGGKAAIGAIAGTVVAGPLGTIAGAAVGGRKRDKSKAFVYLINPENNEEVTLHIRCDETTYRQITLLK
ncbi:MULTISPECIES: hypothetical protein [Bacillus]|uniref:hypothetical protein n=1 Tax=Bacillus TaxID=1386 RepID=UPI0003670833|nr:MULTISPECIES: hypothetical protein [Bacillus]